ncbi:MAG: dodecin family protein [Desulfuromonadales bacterium]
MYQTIHFAGKGIEDAIQVALTKAHKSLDRLSWFEVSEVRGHVDENGNVAEYQVLLKVAFQLK